MQIFTETSFLCALYCEQDNSAEASASFKKLGLPVVLSPLVKFEFVNGLNFLAGRFRRDRNQGMAPRQKVEAARAFHDDLANGVWVLKPADFTEIFTIAEKLSAKHTETDLNRSMDILHVATALHWGAREFLTFDVRQARLARAAGLKTRLKVK
jgi:predicted nucleic acid-binding protein